jgi:hypothetical protein
MKLVVLVLISHSEITTGSRSVGRFIIKTALKLREPDCPIYKDLRVTEVASFRHGLGVSCLFNAQSYPVYLRPDIDTYRSGRRRHS